MVLIMKDLLLNSRILRGFKNLSFLTMGVLVTSVINMVGYLFLVGYLSVKDYSIYAIVGNWVGLFSFFTMNQMSKVVLREGARDFSGMKRVLERTVGMKISLIMIAIIMCNLAAIFVPYEDAIKLYIALFSFDLIYLGANSYLLSVFQAVERMQYIAVLQIINSVIRTGLTIGVLLLHMDLSFIFLVSLATNLVTIYITYQLTRKFVKFRIERRVFFEKKIMRPMLIFSVILFLGVIATQIDVIMISFLSKDIRDAGRYDFAAKLVNPFIMFRNLVGTAFFPVFVKTFHRGTVDGKKLFQISLFMGVLVFLGALAASVIVPLGIIYFFPQYEASAAIFAVLVFYIAFGYMILPFNNALTATYNELVVLKIVWIPPLLNIFFNVLFYQIFGLIGIAYSTLLVTSAHFILYVVLTWRTLKKQKHIH